MFSALALHVRPAPGAASDRRCLRLLVLFLLALYAFAMPGKVVSGDGEAMYQTTKALLTSHQLSIDPRPETAVGRGGRAYSKYGVGQSTVQAPLFIVGRVVAKLVRATDDRPERFAVGMANSAVTAALAAVLYLLLRALGAGPGAATTGALIYGAGTLAWPYARADFSEPLQALCLLGAFYALVRWRADTRGFWAALAGFAAGFAVITKPASVVLLPPLALYFAYGLYGRWGSSRKAQRSVIPSASAGSPPASEEPLTTRNPVPRSARGDAERASTKSLGYSLLAFGIPFALGGLFQAALNLYRFGSVIEFGYGSEPASGFTTPVLQGVDYLLLSSGKGLFWFAPPVIVGLAGLIWLVRMRGPEAAVAACVFLLALLYYARWWAWHGDWCWGPRYMVVTVPFVMIGWAPLLANWRLAPGVVRALTALIVAAGLAASALGTFVDYGNYFSIVADQIGRGVDVRDARLNPPFSPLLGHAWLAKASAYDAFVGWRRSSRGGEWDPTDNPFLADYPWRAARPDLAPEAPERAVGFAPWFAALTGRTPFILYWSGMVAIWLVLALICLGHRLWRAVAVSVCAVQAPLPAPARNDLELATA